MKYSKNNFFLKQYGISDAGVSFTRLFWAECYIIEFTKWYDTKVCKANYAYVSNIYIMLVNLIVYSFGDQTFFIELRSTTHLSKLSKSKSLYLITMFGTQIYSENL